MGLEWLNHADRTEPRGFLICDMLAPTPLLAPQVGDLANVVIDAISDRAVVQRLAEILGDDAAMMRLRAGRKSVARGDFGEAVAGACLEELEGWTVPVRKLRFKIDPEQTQPGSDIVAWQEQEGAIARLQFVETKLRTGSSPHVAVEAHDQLRDDVDRGFGDILEFIAERLAETQHDRYEALVDYLLRRDLDDEILDEYGVFLVWDQATWDEVVLDNLDDADPLLEPLHVRVAQFQGLAGLVADVYDRVGVEVFDDGS